MQSARGLLGALAGTPRSAAGTAQYRVHRGPRHVSRDSAPFLFLDGDADPIVPYQQSVDMVNQLKAAGLPAEIFIAKGGEHRFWNDPRWFDVATKRMEEFFMKYLK